VNGRAPEAKELRPPLDAGAEPTLRDVRGLTGWWGRSFSGWDPEKEKSVLVKLG